MSLGSWGWAGRSARSGRGWIEEKPELPLNPVPAFIAVGGSTKIPPKYQSAVSWDYCTCSGSKENTTSPLPNTAVGRRAEVFLPLGWEAWAIPSTGQETSQKNSGGKNRILSIASHQALYFCVSKPGVKVELEIGLKRNGCSRKNLVIQEIYFNIFCLFKKMLSHSGLTKISL